LHNLPAFPKQKGEWAEVCFLARALQIGLRVAKPYGDSAPYDFIVDSGRKLRRIQVKSVGVMFKDSYQIHLLRGTSYRPYGRYDMDITAAYIIPRDEWYLIPRTALRGRAILWLGRQHEFQKFREAWHLLQ
jgi:hypothetical protein